MANTLGSLAPVIIASAMNAVGNKLAILNDFASDLSDDVVSPRKATISVPLYTAGSTAVINPTTFGGGNVTGSVVNVTMQHVHVPFYLTNAEYAGGYRLEQQVGIHAQALADKIQNLIFANLTEANYGAPAVTGIVAGATSAANLKTLWGSLKGTDKVCYLSSLEMQNFLPTSLTDIDTIGGFAYAGFRKLAHADSFSGAGTKICGFGATDRAGMVFASAIPEVAPKTAAGMESITFELGNGLQVALNIWGDLTGRADNASFDVLFGSAVADPNAIKLLKNA